jgi:xanthine dehydrogenase accessory factor
MPELTAMAKIKRAVDFAGMDAPCVAAQLMTVGEPFALSIVVEARAPTSACVRAKAVFNREGDGICGCVGGGCIESTIAHASIKPLETETPQIVDVPRRQSFTRRIGSKR